MRSPAVFRSPLGLAALLIASCGTAHALIKFDDGHDEIFVTGAAGVSYDSNIFAASGGTGDTSYNASLDIEYHRKAGMLGVDADLAWHLSRFDKFSNESFANPELTAELTKGSGRTTGALKVAVKRENRAETAINQRSESWDYNTNLDLKYPVIERYSFAGGLGYDRRDFKDNSTLVDIETYSANTDLHYALNSERDLTAGYRFRTTRTSVDTVDRDNAFTLGVSGKIISKLNGSVRVGVQNRSIHHRGASSESHTSVTATGMTTWTINSRFSLAGTASRDFVTVASDASVDTTALALDGQYAVNSKTTAFAGINYTHLKFLDTTSAGRSDDGVGFNAGVGYTLTAHVKLNATYGYSKNWSTLAISDYYRHSVSFSISSRW